MSASGSQKTDTRQVLIEAATEVFLKRGFARATTKEIAQTAGWPKAPSTGTSQTSTPCSTRSSSRSPATSSRSCRFPGVRRQGTVRDNLEHLLQLIGRSWRPPRR